MLQPYLSLYDDVRFVSGHESELQLRDAAMGRCGTRRGLQSRGQGLVLVKDDRGFADVALVDRLSAQRTLLPSILLLEVQVLQEARIAE